MRFILISARRSKACSRCDYKFKFKFKIGAIGNLLSSKFWEVRECAWSLKLHPLCLWGLFSYLFNWPAWNSIQIKEECCTGALHFSDCQKLSKVWILEFRKCLENLKRIWGRTLWPTKVQHQLRGWWRHFIYSINWKWKKETILLVMVGSYPVKEITFPPKCLSAALKAREGLIYL